MTDRASLLERLERQALSASGVLRSMAEAKSLRQPGNEAGDKDLYMWPTPDQTTEGQAAAVIRAAASTIEALSERIGVYRDIFAEITAKAQPECVDTNDPERVTSYRLPVGPIHRAAGKLGFQMFNGEAYLRAAFERIGVLEALVQPAYEEGVEDGIDWQRSPCGEPQPQWIDSVARVDLLRGL